MRLKIYNALVNKQPGIGERYHKYHDGAIGLRRVTSWFYLLLLNFAYYVLYCRWIGKRRGVKVYEEKRLPVHTPESRLFDGLSPEKFADELMWYDVISFDIFDTLVFRPFSEPTDLFYIVGQQINYMDFKRIRMEAEQEVRQRKYQKEGTYEVCLSEVWDVVEEMTGIDKAAGMGLEIDTELALCYANPFFTEVFSRLVAAGKHIVITSDMYLPSDILGAILQKCGYGSYEKLYVSNEWNKSKADGSLYDIVKKELQDKYGDNIDIVHVGDNDHSDVMNAEEKGIEVLPYKNVNTNSLLYRSYDMSPIIGGAYRGIVNNHLYCGDRKYNFNQEFGYVYGGIFALGYCSFIHSYSRTHGIDKILFLSRDGEILKKVYDQLYPDDETAYVYISRLAAAKWAASYMKYDYMHKLIYHKVGLGKSLAELLTEMELEMLISFLAKYDGKRRLKPDMKLTSENVKEFVGFINICWDYIIKIYGPQTEAAGRWYRQVVGDAKNALAIDIGWAGSGALALKLLFENRWHIDCRLTAIVAGTNTIHNAEPDMSETMLLDGSMVSYMYSSGLNRDIWKRHNPAKGYNLYFELLTSSPAPSFKGFYPTKEGGVRAKFLPQEDNPAGIEDIQQGMLEFVEDYKKHFGDYNYMFNIKGRDAYAPMILAAGKNEVYLRHIYKNFNLKESV